MLKINGLEKLKKFNFLRVEDLDNGEYFHFVDDISAIYLKTDNCTVVNLSTGEVFDAEDIDDINMPVETLSIEINILKVFSHE